MLLGIVGAALALALSEDLRKKVLDALFGAEEEFEYTSTTAPVAGHAARDGRDGASSRTRPDRGRARSRSPEGAVEAPFVVRRVGRRRVDALSPPR